MSGLLNSIKSLASGSKSVSGKDTTMRFSPSPVPGESGFEQWRDAMRMVAKLPGGIPPEFRKKLWLSLAEKHLQSRGVNWSETERVCFNEWSNPDDSELGVQIVKDLHRTGCSLFCGAAGQENQALLKRVLLAYARWNKCVGYCQGFNMLGALILQVMEKSETNSVKVMIYLIEGVLPASYFANNLRGLSVDMVVFRDLLRMRLPQLSKHLETLQNDSRDGNSYEPPLTNVFTMQWFLTLFCNCLPQPAVLRVWDLIFLEGNEILLRTALTIWAKLADRILAVNSADEFYSIMGVLTREMVEFGLVDTNTLIKLIVAVGPCADLNEMRDRYLYNITPWTHSVQSAAKKGWKLFYSDDDEDDDGGSDDNASRAVAMTTAYGINLSRRKGNEKQSQLAVAHSNLLKSYAQGHPDRERLALDISALKKQYAKLRERQRQAHIILQAACVRQPINDSRPAAPVAINHLLLGKGAILNSHTRRLGPPKGAVPPLRNQHSATTVTSPTETLHWDELRNTRRQSLPTNTSMGNAKTTAMDSDDSFSDTDDSSSSTSTELCDEPEDKLSDLEIDGTVSDANDYSVSGKIQGGIKVKVTSPEVLDKELKPESKDKQIWLEEKFEDFQTSYKFDEGNQEEHYTNLIDCVEKAAEQPKLIDFNFESSAQQQNEEKLYSKHCELNIRSNSKEDNLLHSSIKPDKLFESVNKTAVVEESLANEQTESFRKLWSSKMYTYDSNNLEVVLKSEDTNTSDVLVPSEFLEFSVSPQMKHDLGYYNFIEVDKDKDTEAAKCVSETHDNKTKLLSTSLEPQESQRENVNFESYLEYQVQKLKQNKISFKENYLQRNRSQDATTGTEKFILTKQLSFDTGMSSFQSPVDSQPVEEKRFEDCRKNSKRALKIIQENSLILHRILHPQEDIRNSQNKHLNEESDTNASLLGIAKDYVAPKVNEQKTFDGTLNLNQPFEESLLSDLKITTNFEKKSPNKSLESAIDNNFSSSFLTISQDNYRSLNPSPMQNQIQFTNEYSFSSPEITSFRDHQVSPDQVSNNKLVLAESQELIKLPLTTNEYFEESLVTLQNRNESIDDSTLVLNSPFKSNYCYKWSYDKNEEVEHKIEEDLPFCYKPSLNLVPSNKFDLSASTSLNTENSDCEYIKRLQFSLGQFSPEENDCRSLPIAVSPEFDKAKEEEIILSSSLSDDTKIKSSYMAKNNFLGLSSTSEDCYTSFENQIQNEVEYSGRISPKYYLENFLDKSAQTPCNTLTSDVKDQGSEFVNQDSNRSLFSSTPDSGDYNKKTNLGFFNDSMEENKPISCLKGDIVSSKDSTEELQKYSTKIRPTELCYKKSLGIYSKKTSPDKNEQEYKISNILSESSEDVKEKYLDSAAETDTDSELVSCRLKTSPPNHQKSYLSTLSEENYKIPKSVSNTSPNSSFYTKEKFSSSPKTSPETSPSNQLACLQFSNFQVDLSCASKCSSSESPQHLKPYEAFNLPTLSPPRRKSPFSPEKVFNPFPVQPTTRQPKEIGIRLGLYKDLSKSPSQSK